MYRNWKIKELLVLMTLLTVCCVFFFLLIFVFSCVFMSEQCWFLACRGIFFVFLFILIKYLLFNFHNCLAFCMRMLMLFKIINFIYCTFPKYFFIMQIRWNAQGRTRANNKSILIVNSIKLCSMVIKQLRLGVSDKLTKYNYQL